MPRYDFRCRDCGGQFEVSRPISEAGEPARCPAGHSDTVKLLSTVAVAGSAKSSATSAATRGSTAGASGGGCCGGGCCG